MNTKSVAIAFSMVSSFGLMCFSAYAQKGYFNLVGSWTGSPDCPINIYRDDGRRVLGDCYNGTYDHIFIGRYSGNDRINLKVYRIDPNDCITSVNASLRVINSDRLSYQQQGWSGCGVQTPGASQTWVRRK
ncbi:MAG: hypothetical protein GPJ00_06175 [Microcystis aeruginosa W13-18]|jgi:hypothetical protein|uniref:hypothetical protein n=1 Tax=Microcystis aeruginosa TaxID=1126 RepID=UPI0012B59C7B|nr:hypothetical protein [Microcystis aeruginosa]MDB9394210.1 hypothetical protein [Microcystis aeruginosa CS-573]NCQ84113.1 hypothetical protein [Microcystis aeruginosa W13-18]NCR48755.1 hypothetical protein [Microcystis aeruginosa S11-01]